VKPGSISPVLGLKAKRKSAFTVFGHAAYVAPAAGVHTCPKAPPTMTSPLTTAVL
jgi:hypothetical protein